MKKLINLLLFIVISISIVGCTYDVPISEVPKEEVIEEEQEPTSYIVELDELQTQIINDMSLDVLDGLGKDNGDGTSTYEIPLEDKDKVLQSLYMWFDADLLDIWADNDYLNKVYHSKDFLLYRIYLKDKAFEETFTIQYAKRIFEYGLIYKKFDGKDAWVFILFYDANGDKYNQIDSDMLDL